VKRTGHYHYGDDGGAFVTTPYSTYHNVNSAFDWFRRRKVRIMYDLYT
jgi:hypothetical protein